MNNRVLFIFILNNSDYLDDIITLFVELGVPGATIVESTGMVKYLSEEIPIFAGFREILQGARESNRIIFSVMNKDLVPKVIKGIEEIVGSLNDPGTGVAFSLPVLESWGTGGNDEG